MPFATAHTGAVQDAAGAAVSNASVEILSAGGATLHQLRTDDQGRFQFTGLRPGPVQIRVNGEGFAASESVVQIHSGRSTLRHHAPARLGLHAHHRHRHARRLRRGHLLAPHRHREG
ncbi:MAG: carboxypeptidase regulatory-like domain-containing protein [Bryobacterales bacterium]|nr:carboxypeptidase regulatory-like domain-containing protein [Bryobacterales bacterium]